MEKVVIETLLKGVKAISVIGGLLLCALTIMIILSITGRSLISAGLGPIPGDYELVELCTAIAIFCFLPLCYLRNGHATVDLLYAHFSPRIKWFIDTCSDIAMLLFWIAITWMLYEAMIEKIHNGETTFTLQIPVWWAYAISLIAAFIGCCIHICKTLIQLGLISSSNNKLLETSQDY